MLEPEGARNMGQMLLTEISVRALKGSAKYETFFDTKTPGFGVRAGLKSKVYVVVRGRTRERVSIGKVQDISLADARAEAKRLLSSEPEAKTVSKTFSEAREEFLGTYTNAGTEYQVRKSLERHFKALEAKQLVDIDDGHINRSLEKLKSTPSEQLHAYRYLRTFFRWCVRPPRRYIKHSPMEGYEAPSTDKRGTRILSDEELVAVWNAAHSPRHAIFRVMMLFGTRNTETCVLERIWTSQGVLVIPGEFTKNGRDHAIPLTPLAEHVFSQAQGNNEYHFAGRHGISHITPGALGKLKREVMELSGTKNWQLRDLRRTFRSLAARVGVRREIAELLINHAPPVLDDIYDRYSYISEKREALARMHQSLIWLLAKA